MQPAPPPLQALGSPLVSGDTRVSVLSGGGLRFKAMAFKRRAPRLQMLFLVSGPQAHGVVSVEAKKKKVGGVKHSNVRGEGRGGGRGLNL